MDPPVPPFLSLSEGAQLPGQWDQQCLPCPAASRRLNPKQLPPWLWEGAGICTLLDVYSLGLHAVTCLETRKGEESQAQALLPAAKEIKLSWIQSSQSITLKSFLTSNACSEGLRQIMNSPYCACLFECFSFPLMIPSLSNACSGSHGNTINVCLVLPNGVRKREEAFLAACRMRLKNLPVS